MSTDQDQFAQLAAGLGGICSDAVYAYMRDNHPDVPATPIKEALNKRFGNLPQPAKASGGLPTSAPKKRGPKKAVGPSLHCCFIVPSNKTQCKKTFKKGSGKTVTVDDTEFVVCSIHYTTLNKKPELLVTENFSRQTQEENEALSQATPTAGPQKAAKGVTKAAAKPDGPKEIVVTRNGVILMSYPDQPKTGVAVLVFKKPEESPFFGAVVTIDGAGDYTMVGYESAKSNSYQYGDIESVIEKNKIVFSKRMKPEKLTQQAGKLLDQAMNRPEFKNSDFYRVLGITKPSTKAEPEEIAADDFDFNDLLDDGFNDEPAKKEESPKKSPKKTAKKEESPKKSEKKEESPKKPAKKEKEKALDDFDDDDFAFQFQTPSETIEETKESPKKSPKKAAAKKRQPVDDIDDFDDII